MQKRQALNPKGAMVRIPPLWNACKGTAPPTRRVLFAIVTKKKHDLQWGECWLHSDVLQPQNFNPQSKMKPRLPCMWIELYGMTFLNMDAHLSWRSHLYTSVKNMPNFKDTGGIWCNISKFPLLQIPNSKVSHSPYLIAFQVKDLFECNNFK